MKDFCSQRDIDIQAFMRMASYGEGAGNRLKMATWFLRDEPGNNLPSCGTAGCLVGGFAIRERCRWSTLFALCSNEKKMSLIVERFGISMLEALFLFASHGIAGTRATCESASKLSGGEAVRRLRKFIYYKCRKAELLGDLEASRRIEGDNGFAVVSQEQLETAGV